MRVFRSLAEVPADLGESVATIGKFDGVHAGHRAVIGELLRVGRRLGIETAVITFDRNPLELLAPDKCPPSLVSAEQKLDLLAESGVDTVLMLPFDRTFAALSPRDFVESVLVTALNCRVVLVGSDFRFGAGGAGTLPLLRELGEEFGYEVELIDDVRQNGDRRVSSTWIRELLASGDVEGATRLLGHVPTLRGVVVHGARRGRELGFPTANLSPDAEGLIPADGVYAGWLTDRGKRYPAAISVGDNPTFDGVPARQVEAHVLDEDIDLYDRRVEISFVERIRGMVAYSGVEPLIAQIAEDVDRARVILAGTGEG